MLVSLLLWFNVALSLHRRREWFGCICSWSPTKVRTTAMVMVTTLAARLVIEEIMNILGNLLILPTTDGSHTEKVDALSKKFFFLSHFGL